VTPFLHSLQFYISLFRALLSADSRSEFSLPDVCSTGLGLHVAVVVGRRGSRKRSFGGLRFSPVGGRRPQVIVAAPFGFAPAPQSWPTLPPLPFLLIYRSIASL
jgi:hypothetical protein